MKRLALFCLFALAGQAPAQCPTCPQVMGYVNPAVYAAPPGPTVQTYQILGLYVEPDGKRHWLMDRDKKPLGYFDVDSDWYPSNETCRFSVDGKKKLLGEVKNWIRSLPLVSEGGPHELGSKPVVIKLVPTPIYATVTRDGTNTIVAVNFTDCPECERLRIKKAVKP